MAHSTGEDGSTQLLRCPRLRAQEATRLEHSTVVGAKVLERREKRLTAPNEIRTLAAAARERDSSGRALYAALARSAAVSCDGLARVSGPAASEWNDAKNTAAAARRRSGKACDYMLTRWSEGGHLWGGRLSCLRAGARPR